MPRDELTVSDQKFKETIVHYNNTVDNLPGKNMVGQIKDLYGPKGTMPADWPNADEYNALEIPVPKGLDENMVTAIVLGAMMDPNRLTAGKLSNSSLGVGNTDQLDFNQEYFLANLATKAEKGGRLGKYPPVMVDARRAAKEALEQYAQGNYEPAQKMLNTFIDFGLKQVPNVHSGSTDRGTDASALNPEKATPILVDAVMNKPPFYAQGTLSDILATKTKATSKMMQAKVESMKQKQEFIEGFKNMTPAEKEEHLLDMMFNAYFSSTSMAQNAKKLDDVKNIINDMNEKIGIPSDNKYTIYQEIYEDDRYKDLDYQCNRIYDANHINDIQVIAAEEGGKEKLKELYKESIKKSTGFKKLMKAKTEADVLKYMVDDAANVNKGLERFKSVKLPDVSSDLNKKYSNILEKGKKNMRIRMEEIANEYLPDQFPDYSFQIAEPGTMSHNAELIEEMYNDVKGVTSKVRGSSDNFNNMKDALKELRNHARIMAKKDKAGEVPSLPDLVKYEKLASEVDRLGLFYLQNKTKINSDYAQSRVDEVKDVRRKLNVNLQSFRKQIEYQKKLEIESLGLTGFIDGQKRRQRLNPQINDDIKQTFYGNKYRYEGSIEGVIDFTLFRSAAFTMTTLALAATGKYTIHQLTDPDEIKEAKAEMFDQVQQHLRNFNDPESQRWLARNMILGHKKTVEMTDEAMKNINFNDPNWHESPEFLEVRQIGHVGFDCYQEVTKIPEKQLMSVAKEIYPNVQNVEDLANNYIQAKNTNLYGFDTALDHFEKGINDIVSKEMNDPLLSLYPFITGAYDLKNMKDDIAAKAQNDPDKPYSQKFAGIEDGFANTAVSSRASERYFDPMGKIFQDRPDMLKDNLKAIQDGSFFEGMTGHLDMTDENDPIKLSPAFKNKLTELRQEQFRRNYSDAEKNLNNKKYTNKEEYYRDAAFLMVGKIYEQTHKLPFDFEDNKTMQLNDYAEKQAKDPNFRASLMSTVEPKKLMQPKDVLRFYNNPQNITKMVNDINKKKEELKNQNQKNKNTNLNASNNNNIKNNNADKGMGKK